MPLNIEKIYAFLEQSTAQDAVEYALLLGFLALATAAALLALGNSLSALWDSMNATLSNPG